MRLFPVIAMALLPGCYLSHRVEGDGGTPDAACESPPREVVMMEIEVLSASPAGCARVGTTYRLETDLGGGPLYADCTDSRSVATPDGCGVAVEASCLGVEYERRIRGTLRGSDGRGRIHAFMRTGYAFAECDREEAWRIVE